MGFKWGNFLRFLQTDFSNASSAVVPLNTYTEKFQTAKEHEWWELSKSLGNLSADDARQLVDFIQPYIEDEKWRNRAVFTLCTIYRRHSSFMEGMAENMLACLAHPTRETLDPVARAMQEKPLDDPRILKKLKECVAGKEKQGIPHNVNEVIVTLEQRLSGNNTTAEPVEP